MFFFYGHCNSFQSDKFLSPFFTMNNFYQCLTASPKKFSLISKVHISMYFSRRIDQYTQFCCPSSIFGCKMQFFRFKHKKLKKFNRFKPIEVPMKNYTIQKNCGHSFFLTLKNIKFRKKVGFTCVPLILKIDIFGPQIGHTFLRNPHNIRFAEQSGL